MKLSHFEKKTFSQHGEDGITEKLIELIYNGNNNNKAEKPKILTNFLFLNCIKLV